MSLPSVVSENLRNMSKSSQKQFWEEYYRNKKSVIGIYLFWLFGCQYAYLGKWGVQVIFWITGGGLLFWWILDFFVAFNMVGAYNDDMAVDALKSVKLLETNIT